MESMITADTARLRVLKHLRGQAAALTTSRESALAEGATDADDDNDPNRPKELAPGMMQLFSYYAPSLDGGIYDIEVIQTITHPDFAHPDTPDPQPGSDGMHIATIPPPLDPSKEMTLRSLQKFDVHAPRFSLPPGIVHQTYPPQGLGDYNNVLPHIVFEDPHLPWEQEASHIDHDEESKPATPGEDPPPGRNRVPWLALFTFTEDEIKLTPAQLKPRSAGGLFPEGAPLVPPKSFPAPDGHDQDRSTFAVKLTMSEYLDLGTDLEKDSLGNTAPAQVPIKDKLDGSIDKDQQVDVVFIPADLFQSQFCSYKADGTRIPFSDGTVPDLHRYKYLAHVRNINTKNMADAGVEDDGLYSVVHSHRTGPLDVIEPKPIIVHLVSLEGIEDHMTFPLKPKKTHVALVSLYSWTYLCLPPLGVNFIDAMIHIGETIQDKGQCWLRAPDSVIKSLGGGTDTPTTSFQKRLHDRAMDGFVLQRYLLQTGEESVSFFRGPLVPRYVPPITSSWWPFQSNFSTDYQVVDSSLGVMDITYSAAWQLGRTLGIADQAFSGALVRLRSAVETTARRKVKRETAPGAPGKSKAEALQALPNAVNTLKALGASEPGAIPVNPSNRFIQTKLPAPQFKPTGSANVDPIEGSSINDPPTQAMFASHVAGTTAVLTSGQPVIPPAPATASDEVEEELFVPFSEINIPNSGDWQIVQSWILNNLFLKNIPAHYLIPDASFLPRESIRFFYIDTNWMDAFIDGALSIGNHLSQKDDVVRQSFKRSLNNYFKTSYRKDHPGLDYFPQIPCFGFLLRSTVVQAFPNLEVHAPYRAADDPADPKGVSLPHREPVLRLETIEKDVLLCLFDRMPATPHWDEKVQITISQPPHQQCFQLGGSGTLTSTKTEISFRHLFTVDEKLEHEPSHPDEPFDPHKPVVVLTWDKTNGPDVLPLEDNATAVQINDHKKAEAQIAAAKLPKAIYDWDSRNIIAPNFAQACNEVLNTFALSMPSGAKSFVDSDPTSAVTGTMLTSFISQMKISVPVTKPPPPNSGLKMPPAPPDTLSTPRKIRIQDDADSDPSTWVRVHKDLIDNGSGAVNPLPPPTPNPDNTQMSQPVYPPLRPTPADVINKNTHPDIPISERTQIPKNNKSIILPRDCGPQFIAKVYALRQDPPGPGKIANVKVYANQHDPRNVPIDLVVTLTPPAKNAPFQQDTLHNLQLYTVEVDIPLGNTVTDLCSIYDGPGGKMLSNPRFNVHVTFVQNAGRDIARFTLVPRATTRLVPLRNIPEMNFVIWKVRPNAVPTKPEQGTRGAVEVRITENYRRMDSGTPFDNFGVSKCFLGKVLAGP